MLCAHGGAWLMLRTDGDLHRRRLKQLKLWQLYTLFAFLLLVLGFISVTLKVIPWYNF
jgi:cytochrome bd-type quinol oxidase subunit 2